MSSSCSDAASDIRTLLVFEGQYTMNLLSRGQARKRCKSVSEFEPNFQNKFIFKKIHSLSSRQWPLAKDDHCEYIHQINTTASSRLDYKHEIQIVFQCFSAGVSTLDISGYCSSLNNSLLLIIHLKGSHVTDQLTPY